MAKRLHYKTGKKKGQFRSGKARKSNPKKRKSKRKSKPKKRRKSMAKKKTKRRRRRATRHSDLFKKASVAGWTSVYSYMKEKSDYGPSMMKAPHLEAIGYDATMMLVAHFAAKHGPRFTRKPLDALSTGLAGVVGYRFGAAGFKMSGLGGAGEYSALEEGDEDLSGDVDPDDFDDDDDDDDAAAAEE